jgi:hypothetical protein
MMDGSEAARDRRNLIERIGAKIPGIKTYLEREMQREVDKMERDWLAAELDRARGALQGKVRDWSRSGNLANLDLASSMEKLLDRLANRIRHADYGYSAVFQAVKIREEQLDQLYAFDLALIETVDGLANQIEALPATASEEAVRAALSSIEVADRQFDERATIFEDVTQKGGR